MAKEKNIQVLAEEFIKTRGQREFNPLYERVRPGILNHCYTILKDFELAEDAFLNAILFPRPASSALRSIPPSDSNKNSFALIVIYPIH